MDAMMAVVGVTVVSTAFVPLAVDTMTVAVIMVVITAMTVVIASTTKGIDTAEVGAITKLRAMMVQGFTMTGMMIENMGVDVLDIVRIVIL